MTKIQKKKWEKHIHIKKDVQKARKVDINITFFNKVCQPLLSAVIILFV